ncbi:MAG: endopeptidase La [Spirochaetota bacterium]
MSFLEALKGNSTLELPLVHVRDVVVFPKSITPIFAGTKFAVASADESAKTEKRVVISLLKGALDDGKPDIEVHEVGTLVRIIQQVRLPDGSARLLVEGERRVRIKKTAYRKDHLVAFVEPMPDDSDLPDDRLMEASLKLARKSFQQYAELVRKIPPETLAAVERVESPHELCDLVAGALQVGVARKQDLLSPESAIERLEVLEATLEGEIEILTLQRKISGRVKSRIDRNQKEYFLQEQLKEINKELGREGDEPETVELEKRLAARNPPPEVLAKAKKELARLSKVQALSPEAGVIRTYCEWLADLPWSEQSADNRDIEYVSRALDEDHFGLERPKERILEYIAVQQLSERARTPLLCLVGPPGTGKTSLGRSVARGLGRGFVRFSLGGLRDEAEIRGHRKTYVGALPGKIIQSMRRVATINPVFLLDELDKMSSDFRGDPASALLEVLDPEQNLAFVDHYLEVSYDLSKVLFIATANSLHGIPYALLDRMEVIEVPGYSEFEKLEIAKKFIIPKTLASSGLSGPKVSFRDAAILEVIRHYTMESGVRNLEREIARMARKLAREAVTAGCATDPERLKSWSATVTAKRATKLLGKRRRGDDILMANGEAGIANGLAWTETGGTLLPIEASLFAGEDGLILTGNLGDVMKESARAAFTYIKSRAADFGLPDSGFAHRAIHIHVPEGAIPKDGPSAGLALAATILSAFSGLGLKSGQAMTGEITLTGRVLPVGGVKEKILAAHRNGIRVVLLPEGNRQDLEDVPKEVLESTEFIFAKTIAAAVPSLFPEGSFPLKAVPPAGTSPAEPVLPAALASPTEPSPTQA